MYRKTNSRQLKFANFYLPFSSHLRSDNRWVILAGQIPWQQIEEAYGGLFSEDNGCPDITGYITAELKQFRGIHNSIWSHPYFFYSCQRHE